LEKLIEQFSVGLFFWQTILFLVLVFILKKYAWKPILDSVSEREDTIRESLESAEKAKKELTELQSKNESLIIEAKIERDALLKEAREIKDKIVNDAKGEAKEEADKIVKAAYAAIEAQKSGAIAEMKSEMASLSISIAEKIIRKELSSDEQQKSLANELVADLKLN
jgi:F-type H+-transporting ATPase subunit b|tara:strand:+ start:75 stop:575 length:501 start_codon:yes stop_codon:yes gene_type:complete